MPSAPKRSSRKDTMDLFCSSQRFWSVLMVECSSATPISAKTVCSGGSSPFNTSGECEGECLDFEQKDLPCFCMTEKILGSTASGRRYDSRSDGEVE